jgi:hypothetical protein
MPAEDMGSRSSPENPSVATRIILVATMGFLGFVGLAMAGLLFYLQSEEPGALAPTSRTPFPAPSLQSSPRGDLQAFVEQQRTAMSSYAWVDRGAGIARIPIDVAMSRIVAKGSHAYDPLQQPSGPTAPNGSRP